MFAVRRIRVLPCLIAALLITSCGGDSGKALYNSQDSGEIHIGVVYPVEARDSDTYFREGIELAVSTVNEGGGVLGKTLNTVVRDDRGDPQTAMQIAETLYEAGVTAVVGHWSTNVCYFVEDMYEENRVVMLTPVASGMNLFEYEYDYVFRMIASNQVFADALAHHALEKGYKRAAILYDDDDYGVDFAAVMESELARHDIEVVDRVSGVTSSNLKTISERWRAFGCDSLFVASEVPGCVDSLRLIRSEFGTLPVLGADNFARADFLKLMEGVDNDLYMASYNPADDDPEYVAFKERFVGAYGHEPDLYAVSGYEAVCLLKDAIEAAGTVEADAIAGHISTLQDYRAASGIYTYNEDTNELEGHEMAVFELERGEAGYE